MAMKSWCGAVLKFALGTSAVTLGCGAEFHEDPAALKLGVGTQAFINGEDDRREYFELTEDVQRAALERFTVVLMTRSAADALVEGNVAALPSWGEVDRLCSDQPFVNQPSAAFCSGVLLDWDVVLTSGHCLDVTPLADMRVVFGYYYQEPGKLALARRDVYAVSDVLASRRDPKSDGERLDFAWLELSEVVRPPHEPAAAYTRGRGADLDEPVISIGAGGGVPIKFDHGGQVQDTRPEFDDYFIANTDTSQGSSGGGVFDAGFGVLGSLARGAIDFARSDAGCFVTNAESDPNAAQEQFTYVHRAAEALCDVRPESPLCDMECAQPCGTGLRPPIVASSDGCALGDLSGQRHASSALGLLVCALTLLARRRA